MQGVQPWLPQIETMTLHYIARQLIVEDGTSVSEQDCLAKAGTIVVLAEPGAGKTDLLDSFGCAPCSIRRRGWQGWSFWR